MPDRPRRRRWSAALAALAAALAFLPSASARVPNAPAASSSGRPDLVLVLTDDQSFDALPHSPAVMPYLQGQVEDPAEHWIRFDRAFLNVPLCCPSRATILTGRTSTHTGVETDGDGSRLDDSSTIATWLHDSGYWTGLFGKYLNLYPWGRTNYVPPGWDRWAGKEGKEQANVYYDYTLDECPPPGSAPGGPSCTQTRYAEPVYHGTAPSDYATNVLADRAVRFVEEAPADRPLFLEFTPTAPHGPWTPAPGDGGVDAAMTPTHNPDFNEADVSDKPAWARSLPLGTPRVEQQWDRNRRGGFEALLAVDRAVRRIEDALAARRTLGNSVIVFMTDNGFSFGEHRYKGKACEFEECIRTPLYVRFPGATAHVDSHLVSNVDIAPTLADLGGATPATSVDGASLRGLLDGTGVGSWRDAVLLRWAGASNSAYPATSFWGIRTGRYAYFELVTGEVELYDLAGAHGTPDPWELDNRAGRAAYTTVQAGLHSRLRRLQGPAT